MEAYETTMCGLHDIPTELQAKYKGRAEEPKYAWVHPKGARGSTRAKTCEHSRRWRWLGDRLAEFVRLERAAISSSGARKHRKELLVALRKWRPPPHDPELASEREADHVAPGGRAHCRGKLEDDARAAAHGFRRWVKDATLECFSGFEWWLQECDRLGSRYDSRFQMMQEKRFKQWAIDACAKGGRAAHRWTKKPGGSIAAKVAATPQQKVEDTLEFWHEVWACDETAEDWSLMSADGSLPLATPAAIRAAAKSIKQDTALSFLHPRSIHLLDDAALEALAVMFQVMERLGKPPKELQTLVFLPKPDGTYRPIGLLTGIMMVP